MLFNSPTFIVFLFIVLCLYWAIGRRQPQNVLLLAASYVFYGAWSWKFLLLVDSQHAGRLRRWPAHRRATSDVKRRRVLLIASVAVNLGFLGFFKYYGFFVTEAVDLLNAIGFQAHVRTLEIVLPVGISFYTFQSLSYVVDVYRGKIAAERNPLDYALYVAFFPQLVAGPIERATHLLPQFKRERAFGQRVRKRPAVDRLGLVQEDRDRRQPRAVCERRLRGSGGLFGHDPVHGDGVLRLPDLLRFLRLLGYGARRREDARLRADEELRLPVLFP